VLLVLDKVALNHMHVAHMRIIGPLVNMITLPFIFIYIKQTGIENKWDWTGVWLAVASFVLGLIGGICFEIILANGNDAGKAVAITSSYPLLTVFLSWLYLSEKLSNWQIAGTVMIIAGLVMMAGK
jgi:uncharacterized membrane protein